MLGALVGHRLPDWDPVEFRIHSLPSLPDNSQTTAPADTWSVVATNCAAGAARPVQQVLRSRVQDSSSLFTALRHNTTGQQLVAVPMPWSADCAVAALEVC